MTNAFFTPSPLSLARPQTFYSSKAFIPSALHILCRWCDKVLAFPNKRCLKSDNERRTAPEAATQPQEENFLELGKDVPRVSSCDGRGRPVAHHSLQVCPRKRQAAKCHSRTICQGGDSQGNRRVKPEVRFTKAKPPSVGILLPRCPDGGRLAHACPGLGLLAARKKILEIFSAKWES